MCNLKLENYRLTLKGDLDALENQDLTNTQRDALIVTIDEKRVLHELIRKIDKIIDILMMEEDKVLEMISDEGQIGDDIKEYMGNLVTIL